MFQSVMKKVITLIDKITDYDGNVIKENHAEV